MTTPRNTGQPAPFTTLRDRNGFSDSILFFGHTLAGFPTGNLRSTLRTRDSRS